MAGMAVIGYSFVDVPTATNGILFVVKLSWLVTCCLTFGAAADVLIAASMLYYLRRMDSSSNEQLSVLLCTRKTFRTNFCVIYSTTNIINRLVRFSLRMSFITQ